MIWYDIRSDHIRSYVESYSIIVFWCFLSYCIHFIVAYATYCFLHVIVDTCVCIHTILHFFKRHMNILLFIYSAIVYSWSYMIYMTDYTYYTFYSIYNIIYCNCCSNKVVRHNFKCSFATDDYVLSESFLGSENVVVFLRVTSPRTVWSPTKSIHQVDLHRPTQIDQNKLTWVDQSQYHHVIQLDSQKVHFTCQFMCGVASHGDFSMPRCFGNVLVSWCYASLELIVPWGRHMGQGYLPTRWIS